jgi:hypothetical protein
MPEASALLLPTIIGVKFMTLLSLCKGEKMFTILQKELRSEKLRSPMQKLATCVDYKNIQNLKRVANLLKETDAALQVSQKEWVALATKYIKKDKEKGIFLVSKDGPEWLDGVDVAAAEAEIDAFMDKEVLIKAPKLPLSDIACVKLSPSDIVGLDPLLTE